MSLLRSLHRVQAYNDPFYVCQSCCVTLRSQFRRLQSNVALDEASNGDWISNFNNLTVPLPKAPKSKKASKAPSAVELSRNGLHDGRAKPTRSKGEEVETTPSTATTRRQKRSWSGKKVRREFVDKDLKTSAAPSASSAGPGSKARTAQPESPALKPGSKRMFASNEGGEQIRAAARQLVNGHFAPEIIARLLGALEGATRSEHGDEPLPKAAAMPLSLRKIDLSPSATQFRKIVKDFPQEYTGLRLDLNKQLDRSGEMALKDEGEHEHVSSVRRVSSERQPSVRRVLSERPSSQGDRTAILQENVDRFGNSSSVQHDSHGLPNSDQDPSRAFAFLHQHLSPTDESQNHAESTTTRAMLDGLETGKAKNSPPSAGRKRRQIRKRNPESPDPKKPGKATRSKPANGEASESTGSQVRRVHDRTKAPKGDGRSEESVIPSLDMGGPDSSTITFLRPSNLEVTPLNIQQPPVPNLEHGLDRVLFNPGVYQLQDPVSRVYNFDPYLQDIMPVVEFDFNALKEYKTSSRDTTLSALAIQHGKRYIGSTSSMTSTLAQFHYLLSNFRELNLDMLSRGFRLKLATFTNLNKAPTAIFLRWKDGTYAIDADKEFDGANVLMLLGKSMEKLLTLPTPEFERYRKSDPRSITEEERMAPEAYEYTTMGDFLMRSQLDAYDPRLPGTGMFDLKTRAVLSVRMDAEDFEPMTGYQIHTLQGTFESYEREYYDMMRATMLKYMLQVRMGRMEGIFAAYHNVERIFGFQFISLPDMDRAIHGQTDLCLGDQEFRASLDLMNSIFNKATAKFPEKSLRFHFETKEEKTMDSSSTVMWIYAEPMDEEEIDRIQSTSKEKVAEFEKTMMGIEKLIDESTHEAEENCGAEPGIGMESVESPSDATKAGAAATTEPEQASEEQADKSTSDPSPDYSNTKSGADPAFLQRLESAKSEVKPLFVASLMCRSKVNDVHVQRPQALKSHDDWQLEYALKEWGIDEAMWAKYEQAKFQRRDVLMKDSDDDDEVPGTEAAGGEKKKKDDGFIELLRSMSQRGREFRGRMDKLDAGKVPVVVGQPLRPAVQQVERVYVCLCCRQCLEAIKIDMCVSHACRCREDATRGRLFAAFRSLASRYQSTSRLHAMLYDLEQSSQPQNMSASNSSTSLVPNTTPHRVAPHDTMEIDWQACTSQLAADRKRKRNSQEDESTPQRSLFGFEIPQQPPRMLKRARHRCGAPSPSPSSSPLDATSSRQVDIMSPEATDVSPSPTLLNTSPVRPAETSPHPCMDWSTSSPSSTVPVSQNPPSSAPTRAMPMPNTTPAPSRRMSFHAEQRQITSTPPTSYTTSPKPEDFDPEALLCLRDLVIASYDPAFGDTVCKAFEANIAREDVDRGSFVLEEGKGLEEIFQYRLGGTPEGLGGQCHVGNDGAGRLVGVWSVCIISTEQLA